MTEQGYADLSLANQLRLMAHLSRWLAKRELSIEAFLHLSGETSRALATVVPSTTCWRLASLPKALEPNQVRAVLANPDRRTVVGSRDYAALLLMLRLGLRACEVAALTLDDLDWTRGEIIVRGKGSTSRLPLPRDVGQALVAWLRRRRRVPTRAVFLCARAPHRPARAHTIVHLARRALRDAGVPTGGGHRFRHTAATMMLQRGASMTEIAQVLRHRHVDTARRASASLHSRAPRPSRARPTSITTFPEAIACP